MGGNGADKQPSLELQPCSTLLRHNLKLRHLHGITIRNLNKNVQSGQHRATTSDDTALPSALISPVKLLASQHCERLVQSRSFDNLRTENLHHATHCEVALSDGKDKVEKTKSSPRRPRAARRMSTHEWLRGTSADRLSSIEDSVKTRTADVFFSLHVYGATEPVYVSEVVERSMVSCASLLTLTAESWGRIRLMRVQNPTFRAFDLNVCSPHVTRSSRFTIKVWVSSGRAWSCLLEARVDLSSLQYVGNSVSRSISESSIYLSADQSKLETLQHPLLDNGIVFQARDGLYVGAPDLAGLVAQDAADIPDLDQVALQPSCSYDILVRLVTLDECIQDAMAMRRKLVSDIDALMRNEADSFFANDRLLQRRDALSEVTTAVAQERRALKTAHARLQQARSRVKDRKESLTQGRDSLARVLQALSNIYAERDELSGSGLHMNDDILAQRRRICSDLSDLYLIEPIPERALAFTINNCALPDSTFEDADQDTVSAALGHVAHVVYILSFYLSMPLPYPITPSSSTSYIQDPISSMTGSRIFPLFMPRAVLYRFEYGVFLLNKNIELLAGKLGLKLLDIRQTLPNLKYILFVASAGQGELPSRKAGGVRGLLGGRRVLGTPDSSRRSSFDSTRPGHARLKEQLRSNITSGLGKSRVINT